MQTDRASGLCLRESCELSAAALDALDRELANAAPSRYAASGAFLHRLREDHARWLREAGRIEGGCTATARALEGAPDVFCRVFCANVGEPGRMQILIIRSGFAGPCSG